MTGKRLSKEELEAWLRAVDVSEGGPDAAAALREHIAALESVPDDVAQEKEWAASMLRDWVHVEAVGRQRALVAVDRLATAAAQVPGLVEELAQRTRERDSEMEERFKVTEVKNRQTQRAETAESERDAARQEVERLGVALGFLSPVPPLETLLAYAERAKDALGVVRDSREEVETLTSRVAELESLTWDLVRVGVLMFEGAEGRADSNARVSKRQADRATAAEARLAEMARLVNEAAALRGAQPTPAPGLREAVASVVESLRWLQVPGVVAEEEVRVPLGWVTGRRALAILDAYDATPPPGPGLREAVGRILVHFGAWDGTKYVQPLGHTSGCGCAACSLLAAYDGTAPEPAAQLRSLASDLPHGPDRAAVEAAINAEPSVTHAQLAAAVEEYVRETHEAERAGAIYRDRRDDRCSGAREVLGRVTGGQVPSSVDEWRDKAAKWDALRTTWTDEAVDRWLEEPRDPLNPPEDQLLREFRNAMLGLTLPTAPGGGETDDDASLPDDGPSSLLMSRFARGEVVPTAPGGGETEVLPQRSDGRPHLPPGRFYADDEGPRPDPDDHWCKGECGDLTFNEPGGHEAWHRARGDNGYTPRARIAPTLTPERPALAPKEGTTWWACACGWSGRAVMLKPTPAGGLACPTCGGTGGLEGQPQPEPAAPEVVWEGDGWRVLSDGVLERHGFGQWVQWNDPYLTRLACALAEAKRENATLKKAAAGALQNAEDMNPTDRANALLAWGCAGSIQTALRRERVNRMDAARKAAEDMRERACAELARVHQDGNYDDHIAALLMDIHERIRALPL